MTRIDIDPTFGALLRRLRKQAGLTLRELGAAASYSHTYIWDLERAKKLPSRDAADRFDVVLGAAGRLIAAATISGKDSREPNADLLVYPPDWQSGISMAVDLWRGDMTAPDPAFQASAYLVPAVRWLTASLDEEPAGHGEQLIGPPEIDTIGHVTNTFRGLDNLYGGGHIYAPVVRFLNAEVAPMLRGRYEGQTGLLLMSAAAEMTQLAGWAAYDCGLHGAAQKYLIRALRLAMAAGNRPLGAELLAAMSHQCGYLGASAEAIDLARAASRVAAIGGIDAIRAEADVLEAHGHALAGDEPSTAKALNRAERTLDRADRSADPRWLGYFDEAYLAARFGHCFISLGRGDLGAPFARRSLDMDPRFVRGHQFNTALTAISCAQSGDVDEAGRLGVDAVRGAEGLKSQRAVDYLARIATALAPYAGVTAVDEFTEQAQPLLTAGR